MDKDLINGKIGADCSYDIAVKAGNVSASLSFDNAELSASINLVVKTKAGLELLKPHLPLWAQPAIPLIEGALSI